MSAIREATRAELVDFGYAGVTYEGVARRAQTSKHVLYRRYRSRAHLVLDALPSLRWQPDDSVLRKCSLREGLLSVFSAVTEVLVAFGIDNYRSLIAEADDELFSTLDLQVTSVAERTVFPALEHARARGELGPHDIPRRAAASIGVLVRNEMVFSRNNLNANTIAEILDTVYLPLVKTLSSHPIEAH